MKMFVFTIAYFTNRIHIADNEQLQSYLFLMWKIQIENYLLISVNKFLMKRKSNIDV